MHEMAPFSENVNLHILVKIFFFHLSWCKRSVNINYDVDLNYEAGNLLRTLVNEGNKSLFAYSGTN